MNGAFGESLANTLIGQWTQNGQLFETVAIGGTWPTIDIYAEMLSTTNQRMFCFFQVKSTELGYTKKGIRKLKVQAPQSKLNKLASFNAPTYLIGVDYNKVNPPLSACYIRTIRGNYTKGISSMEITYPLNPGNLILLKNEVEAFWTSLNPLNSKSNYLTNF